MSDERNSAETPPSHAPSPECAGEGTPRRAVVPSLSILLPRLAPLAVGTVVAALYIVYGAWQWAQLTIRSWDLSIFTQLLQSYSHLQPPIVSVKGDGYNLLGDHFHPLLAVLTPIFAVFPHAFTLIVIQALCFALAAGIIAHAAIRHLGSVVGGTLVGGAFGLSWGLQYAGEAQFHEIALAVPLLSGAMAALLERRWTAAAVWSAPLVFVKEDLGLTVFAIGLLIAVLSRRLLGVWLALWGLAWIVLAVLVFIPLLNPDGAWAYAGNANPSGALSSLASLFNPAKAETILLLLTVTGGLLLRSPIALLLLPTLGWRFLSSNSGYWGPSWHYSAVLMPIAFVALLDGISRARAGRTPWLRTYAGHGVAISVTAAVVLLPALPLWNIVKPGAWNPPERATGAHRVLAAIPTGASVETDIGLMSYVVDDHRTFWLGNQNPAPGCLLIDRVAGGTPAEWGDVLAVGQRLHPDIAYEHVFAEDGYELACTPAARG